MDNTLEQARTEFSDNLWRTYDWFSGVFAQKIQEAAKEFFNLDLSLKLFSIGENSNVLFRGEQYFVTQIKVTKNLMVGVRLSQTAIKNLLEETLGKGVSPFMLEKLSELEVKILTSFNDFLFSELKNILTPQENINKNELPISLCHMVFYTTLDGRDFGKIVLTIPTNLIEPEPIVCENEIFSLGDFKNCLAYLRVKVGSSKIKLGEVESLQKDDIILLENSNIYKMTICNGDEEVEFKISPDPSIILNTDNEGEDMGEETASVSSLWDNIQVDINAEFEKVKISLGELKQISEGLVVDIGSIYDNKIDLRVENKLVAKGELVIINDRYGVRIDEVIKEEVVSEAADETYEEENESEFAENTNANANANTTTEIDEEEFEDEDFNYDDFDEENEI